ncbi:MAG TPA: hypothetical protein VEA35_04035 [Ramlibacter sp.]|nr:hypothetical protein [Candidatus Limnocylindrales bacterium]HYF41598.1 hypothetical protein [Ramlibacter sp.]
MLAELAAVLGGPLNAGAWHQQRAWHGAGIVRGRTAQPGGDFAGAIGGEQHRPVQHLNEASESVQLDPGRRACIERGEHVVAHHAARLDDGHAMFVARGCGSGCAQSPAFYFHDPSPSLVADVAHGCSRVAHELSQGAALAIQPR